MLSPGRMKKVSTASVIWKVDFDSSPIQETESTIQGTRDQRPNREYLDRAHESRSIFQLQQVNQNVPLRDLAQSESPLGQRT